MCIKNLEVAKSWKKLLEGTLEPSILLPTIIAAILWIFMLTQNNLILIAILSVFISLLTGYAGNNLSKINEKGEAKIKGDSAVRDLKIILRSLVWLEDKTRSYITSETIQNIETNNFRWIADYCYHLAIQVTNAIESWKDLVPNADIKGQIEIFIELKQQINILQNQISTLNSTLQKAEESQLQSNTESIQTIAKLKNELAKSKEELRNTEQKLRDQSHTLDIPATSGSALFTTLHISSELGSPLAIIDPSIYKISQQSLLELSPTEQKSDEIKLRDTSIHKPK